MNKGYIYVYTTETYEEYNSWYKIGKTEQESAQIRVAQQDGTSNPESLKIVRTIDLSDYDVSADKAERMFHKHFSKQEVRKDKSREWFEITLEEFDEATKLLIDPEYFKKKLELRPHQKDAKEWMLDIFNSGEDHLLLNHKPRSGKSFMMYDFMINNPYQIKNVLLLTQYPIVNGQWKSEFENIRGHKFNIVNVSGGDKIKLDEQNLIMLSLQDAKGENDESQVEFLKKQKFDDIRNIEWDLVIFDEIHKGKETPKTDKLLSSLKYKKLVGLSATPTKNLVRGTFTMFNTHIYGLYDEYKYQNEFPEEYGVKNPKINWLLYNIPDDVKSMFIHFNPDEQYTWRKLLKVENNKLYYESDLRIMFSWLFGKGRFRKSDTHKTINKANNILMFVETNESQSLIKELLDDVLLESWNVYYTNSELYSSKQLLKKIRNEFSKNNTIVIANRQLTTGITLENCDMVMFMNDWKSMDEYIQASYRCQSPSDGKENCYVIDLDPARSYNIINGYIVNNIVNKIKNTTESIEQFIECAPIFESFNGSLKNIDFREFSKRVTETLDFSSREFFNKKQINIDGVIEMLEEFKNLGEFGFGVEKTEIVLDEENGEKGKNNVREKLGGGSERTPQEKEDLNKALEIALQNAEYIYSKTPLLCIFTEMKYDTLDMIFDNIETDKKEMYLETLLIDFGVNVDIAFDSIIKLYKSKAYDTDKIDYELFFFNNKLKDLIYKYKRKDEYVRNIQDIFNFINQYLGVSEVEKKQNGEVFTPFELINEMLDTLPEEVWSNPDLKWLDPANGVGNFPAVVLERLMVGLKDWEPNEEKRYKHIIENMIYVCDISPKNMFLYLNIFDPNDEYDMNYHRGSFLEDDFSDVMKKWEVEKFDIVVGNPPYLKGVWIKFLKKLLPINNKYSVIVSPDGTKNYSKVSENLIKLLQDNNIQKITDNTDFFNVESGTIVTYYFNKEKETNKSAHIITNSKTNIVDKIIKHKNKCLISELSNNRSKKFNAQEKRDNKCDNFSIKIIENAKNDGLTYKYLRKELDLNKNIKSFCFNEWYITNRYFGKTKNSVLYEISEDFSIGSNILIIKKPKNSTIKNFISIYNSKLFLFVLNILRNGMFDTSPRHLNMLPEIDTSRSWTDQELYEYFDLTQEEIDLIETTIK